MLRLVITEKQFRELVMGHEVLLVGGPGGQGIAIILVDVGFVAMRQAVEAAARRRRA